MLNEMLRQPVQRAVALSVLPALLVAAWLAAPADDSDPTTDPTWHNVHSADWDDLGHNPVMLWSATAPDAAG